MSIEEIKIHNCNNNTTIFNTDDWIKNDDFIKFAKSKQQKIDQLEREVEGFKLYYSTTEFKIIRENQQLKERNKEFEEVSVNEFMNFYTEYDNGLNTNSTVAEVIKLLKTK